MAKLDKLEKAIHRARTYEIWDCFKLMESGQWICDLSRGDRDFRGRGDYPHQAVNRALRAAVIHDLRQQGCPDPRHILEGVPLKRLIAAATSKDRATPITEAFFAHEQGYGPR